MRALFLLLVLANLVFFAYAHISREGVGAGDSLGQLQVAPERIRLLKAAGEMPADKPRAPGRAIPPTPRISVAPSACLEWGVFAGPHVSRAETALAQLPLAPGQLERLVTDAGGYWVYMPPLKTKAEVDKKIGELKTLGVTEFFVVQDPGQWRNAISLGIFRSEEAAQAFLAKLKERGVRSAIAARRENFLKQVAFYVREPSDATVARVTALQREFPGTEIRAGPCPVGAKTVIAQEVPNCTRVAELAAAIRAGNTQRVKDLSTGATALEIQAGQTGERGVPGNLGPREVREGVLRACLQAAG